jgi:hypothetical protein
MKLLIQEIPKRDKSKQGLPIVEGEWIRKALLVEKKLLVAEDHTGAIKEENGGLNLTVAHHTLAKNCEAFAGNLPQQIHVVAHTRGGSQELVTPGLFSADSPDTKVLVIHAGSSVVPSYTNGPQTTGQQASFIWLRVNDLPAYGEGKWLGQFLELSFAQAEELVKCKDRAGAHAFEERFPDLLDVLFPGRIEHQLAHCLLREAQAACKGQNRVTNFKETGLTIHAPKSLEDWCKPYDSENEGGGAKSIRTLARCIMDEGDPGGESGWGEVKEKFTTGKDGSLRSAVAAFLKVPDTAQSPR